MDLTANALVELRKESQSIFNRIRSIVEDAAFVNRVHEQYPHLPLLPNMRCGAWYTNPNIASTERAYFKSTDGHTNNWSFNLRRPNLHLLPLIASHGGFILVDSTRAGKRIPDALSKTVPIWCSVVNRVILKKSPELTALGWDTALYTPPGVVSQQEHSQIESRLEGWALDLANSSYELPKLDCPLRPIWITPATSVFPSFPTPLGCVFHPIVCVSASKQVTDGLERRASGFSYIQGSGDDHELWSMGLNPDMFWKNYDLILGATSSGLPGLVRSLVSSVFDPDFIDPEQALHATPIKYVSGMISICPLASLQHPSELIRACSDVAFLCLASQDTNWPTANAEAPERDSRILSIQTPEGKKGQHYFLSVVLPRSLPFIQHHLHAGHKVCVACTTGMDLSVGVAVAALAMFFRDDGSIYPQGNGRDGLSKDVLKTRLQWIISSYPSANPSRTTLKRVNDFLLSPPSLVAGQSRVVPCQSS